MLKASGVDELFLPKFYPNNAHYRSGSIDWSQDQFLTIPKADLNVLNEADWYGRPGQHAWEIANQYFDIAFFIANHDTFREITDNFTGAAIYRAYGLEKEMSYRTLLDSVSDSQSEHMVRRLGNRFWFGEVFDNLHAIEPNYLSSRAIHLPLGIMDSDISEGWNGSDARILFVCPDIAGNSYYRSVYHQFKEDFDGFDFAIGGAQYQQVNDPRILGFLPLEEHLQNMRDFRLMFYHSSEPRHIHYHPLEAIKSGMPVLFMAGGILDRFGGIGQPGRCTTIAEARRKARQILDGDNALISSIRKQQVAMLDPISRTSCEKVWNQSISRVVECLAKERNLENNPNVGKQPLRIAIIVPTEHRGGVLTSSKLLAEAISLGSKQAGEPVEVVFGHLESSTYSDADFLGLPGDIVRRPFRWQSLSPSEAVRACAYAGYHLAVEASGGFQVPDDGITQFVDCDLIILASDRLLEPLLPIYRYGVVVHDVLQRYFKVFPSGIYEAFQACAQKAAGVITTTEFTKRDAMQFSGIAASRISTLPPIISSKYSAPSAATPSSAQPYFVWPTNLGPHKNHQNALEALSLYYDSQGDDALDCYVTGTGTDKINTSKVEHLAAVQNLLKSDAALRLRVHFLGEISDTRYERLLANSRFLFHPTTVDNGTYAVLEAAALGVPSLSNDYPAMREVCEMVGIHPSWMDASSPRRIAEALSRMTQAETEPIHPPRLSEFSVEKLAPIYWSSVRAMLPLWRIVEAQKRYAALN